MKKKKKQPLPRKCRVCGCTDDNCSQCVQAQGYPCHWVEKNLCSRCQNEINTEMALSGEDISEEDLLEEQSRREYNDYLYEESMREALADSDNDSDEDSFDPFDFDPETSNPNSHE